jgi:hypothetical protein
MAEGSGGVRASSNASSDVIRQYRNMGRGG